MEMEAVSGSSKNSVIYLSRSEGESRVGFEMCKSLLGKRTNAITGGIGGLLACCDEGCYDIITGKQYYQGAVAAGAVGKDHFVCVSNGQMYSWGKGFNGELGLGPKYQNIELPMPIKYQADFAQVVSGDYHSIATDSSGSVYIWGQNCDRQLGLYTKDINQMTEIKQNAMIEEVLFMPRKLPFCVKRPIQKIACGARFTIAVTKKGEVWSWGAGECGQLGTGRCTYKEIPSQVQLDSSLIFDNVACGDGHVLVSATDGSIYGWGINKRGQLGLGDTATKHQPNLVPGINSKSIYAHSNSSAAITEDGLLYTWGSGSYGRLMHGNETHIHVPTMVNGFTTYCPVSMFAFGKCHSAALVKTHATELFPSKGPQKSFTKLQIKGCGFWNSDKIIVKFTSLSGAAFIPPRSCLGKLVNDDTITCKPPKLSDIGDFEVSLSMDGHTFVPDNLLVTVYKDFSVQGLSPKLINLGESQQFQIKFYAKGLPRFTSSTSNVSVEGGEEVVVEAPTNLVTVIEDQFIKLFVTISSPDGNTIKHEAVIKGSVIETLGGNNDKGLEEGSSMSRPSSSVKLDSDDGIDNNSVTEEKIQHEVVCDVDILNILSGIDASNSLISIRAAFSMNGQDFCEATPESETLICHSFRATNVLPNAYPYSFEAYANELKVKGESFIPTAMLPQGTRIEAVFQADIDKTGVKREVVVPIRCESADAIYVNPPTIIQLMQGKVVIEKGKKSNKSAPSSPTKKGGETLPTAPYIAATLHFQMSSAGSSATEVLGSQKIDLYLYQAQPISVTPSFIRVGSDNNTLTIKGLQQGGFMFPANSAQVCFSRGDMNIQCLSNEVVFQEVKPAATEEVSNKSTSTKSKKVAEKPSSEYILLAKCPVSFVKVPVPSVIPDNNDVIDTVAVEETNEIVQENEPVEVDNAEGVVTENAEVSDADADADAAATEPLPAEEVVLEEPKEYVDVSVLLDGTTILPAEYCIKLLLFESIVITGNNAPKGGAASGNTVDLTVSGLINASDCVGVVRLRGVSGAAIDIPATINIDASTMSFVIPDPSSLSTVDAELRGKDKFYFVDVSIDNGQSFDASAEAILQIK